MLAIYGIELTNYCNLKCVHCPSNDVKYPRGFLSKDNFLKSLEYVGDVGLHLHGEPLLHPQACEFIEIAKKHRNRSVNLNTNGTLLSEDMCHNLVEAGIDIVEVSIHTEKSLAGFKRLFDANDTGVKLIANILLHYHDEFKNWIKNVGITKEHLDCLRFMPMHNWSETIQVCENYVGTIDEFLTLDHKPDTYKLCASCSSSWITGGTTMYYPVTEDWVV